MATSIARPFPLRRDASSPITAGTPRGANDDACISREARGSSRREPAWLVDLTAQVTRSIDVLEHMAERVGTIRDDNSYLRALTANLREALEVERVESGRKMMAQGLSVAEEQRRAAEAERSADALARMLCDLERQITGRRERDAGQAPAPRKTFETDRGSRLRRYA